MGTFSNKVELFQELLDTLAAEPVNVIATIGTDRDPAELTIPGNAVVERFVPQGELLPYCSAVIHHAGAGTSFGVLAHGLPALVLPQSADNFTIAARLTSSGAALTLMPSETTARSVQSGLRQVLGDRSYRQGAEQLAAEIARMPSPAEVARTWGPKSNDR